MKKKIISILICLITIISCFSLNGCLRSDKYEDYFFLYEKNNDFAVIVGLTELGKEQEVLVVPKQIEGLQIKRIGKSKSWFGYDLIASGNLEKIFVKNSTQFIFIYDGFLNCDNLENVILMHFDVSYLENYSDSGDYRVIPPQCVINKETYDEIKLSEEADWLRKFKIANIEFRLNYKEGKEDIFWLDNEPADSLITKWYEGYYSPEREGYSFVGWYKESECVNEWDFENDKTLPDILDEETGETKKQVTRLYAKWNKN